MVPKSFVQDQGLIFDVFSSENFERKVKNLNKLQFTKFGTTKTALGNS